MQLSFLLLSASDVAVIVAVPTATAVTLPLASTVATSSSLDDQLIFLLVAFEGVTVAVSCAVSSTNNVKSFGVTLIALTFSTSGSGSTFGGSSSQLMNSPKS